MRSYLTAPLLALGLASASLALAARAGEADPPVFASSIGGVVKASPLPGKAGQGYLVYNKWCAGCHAAPFLLADPAADAKLSPVSRLPLGTNLLQQKYEGAIPAVLEQRTDLTAEAIAVFVRNGSNAMPAFRKTEISDTDLAALSAYLTRAQGPAEPGG